MTLFGQSRPNIILFLVDDMGWMDTSVPFADSTQSRNRLFKTPNMERLAGMGTRFAHAYATPVCTPTRISLLTGMNAAQHGVTNWTSPWKNDPTDSPDEQFSPAPWRVNGLSPIAGIPGTVHATPLPQLLKEAGYFTIHVGKAHWGPMGTPGANPYNLGFMVNISGHSAGHPPKFFGRTKFWQPTGQSVRPSSSRLRGVLRYGYLPHRSAYVGGDQIPADSPAKRAALLPALGPLRGTRSSGPR